VNKAQEAAADKKMEKHFRSHRELPTGRDFRCFQEKTPEADQKYRDNFDRIFPKAPGFGL
jgi:hypothetical protein